MTTLQTLGTLGNFSWFCCHLLTSSKTFSNKSFGNTECYTVWTQIRTDVLSVLIWVQTVYKGFQQTTKFAASKERANGPAYEVLVLIAYTLIHYFNMYANGAQNAEKSYAKQGETTGSSSDSPQLRPFS